MKPLTERTQKELAYCDAKSFLEGLLTDPAISQGIIKEDVTGGFYAGTLNLNMVTAEIQRYVGAAISYNKNADDLKNGREYLMSVSPDKLTIEDALEAFGFGRNGLG